MSEDNRKDALVLIAAARVEQPGLQLAKDGHAGTEPVTRPACLEDSLPDGRPGIDAAPR